MNAIFPAIGGILTLLAFGLLFAANTSARAVPGARLRVRIENVSPKGGMMRLGLYAEESHAGNAARPLVAMDVPAAEGPIQTVEFRDVPPGTYAVQVFQDLNGNAKIDFAKIDFAKMPGFARVKITLHAGMNAPIVIHLRNSDA